MTIPLYSTFILFLSSFTNGYNIPSHTNNKISIHASQTPRWSLQASEPIVTASCHSETTIMIPSTLNPGDEIQPENFNRRKFIEQSAALAALAIFGCSIPAASAAIDDQTSFLTTSEPYQRQIDVSSSILTSQSSVATIAPKIQIKPILEKAAKRALGGGKAGASAAVVQVFSLMWLRTAMNYQYRYGGDLNSSLKTLWSEGGISRLYQGLPFALVQGPLTRFGDTAANVGILALLESFPETASLPLPLKTVCGSVAAGSWRILCMPIDTSKTAMQVQGSEGFDKLKEKVLSEGPSPLYQGAIASAVATAVGHFPWYLTYNYLNEAIPEVSKETLLLFLGRSALIGLTSSCVSDCCSNSIRVIKTTKQTASLDEGRSDMSYKEIIALILEQDGLIGLFGRGLQTRLLTNALQGAVFSVLWKYFQTA